MRTKYCFQVSGRDRGKAGSIKFRKKETRRVLIRKIRPSRSPSFRGLNPQKTKEAVQGLHNGNQWGLVGSRGMEGEEAAKRSRR